jgi:hypothetical protein
MLLNFEEVCKILLSNNITIRGVFHIGAFECEELPFYNNNLAIYAHMTKCINDNDYLIYEQKFNAKYKGKYELL